MEGFDVAVVGAGPAGLSAACILGAAGIKTIVLERGEYPGAKNMSGGVLYGRELEQILPDYRERRCPVERNIIESRIWYLSKESGFNLGYRDAAFGAGKKHNAFTVLRAKFDRWYADQARQRGALVVHSTVVTDLLKDERGAVTGVATGRQSGQVTAKVTLLADGVNSPLAARTGFRPEPRPENVALAVKEIIEMPADVINSRFSVSAEDGVTTEVMGEITAGMDGVGVIYTNQNSLSVAIGANLADLATAKVKPYELIESFKAHPMVAPLIAGGTPREYIAHWLPEGGYDSIPPLYGDGYLIAGDSAMLFNALHREGNNLAMASGRMAAEAIIEAFKRNDFSARSLSGYAERLEASFVLKDMRKYRRYNRVLHGHHEVFDRLPRLASFAAREMLSVDGVPKKEKQRVISRELGSQQSSMFRNLRMAWQLWRSVK